MRDAQWKKKVHAGVFRVCRPLLHAMCVCVCAHNGEPKKRGLECVNACVSLFLTVDQQY